MPYATPSDKSARNAAQNPETIGTFPIRPFRAVRAFLRLVADKEDTVQVFKFVRALTGDSFLRGYRRLIATPEGGRQAFLAEELSQRLEDHDWLSGFAEGTVGARYRAFIALRNLSAYGLAEESRRLGETDVDAAHPIAWYVRRMRDVHDVWHVLTGYGTDALGEVCLLAFTYAQTSNRALGFLATAGAFELKRRSPGEPYLRAVLEAWRHGRSARWLQPLDYEELFLERLDAARLHLKIERPRIYERIPPEARNANESPAEATLTGYWPSKAA